MTYLLSLEWVLYNQTSLVRGREVNNGTFRLLRRPPGAGLF